MSIIICENCLNQNILCKKCKNKRLFRSLNPGNYEQLGHFELVFSPLDDDPAKQGEGEPFWIDCPDGTESMSFETEMEARIWILKQNKLIRKLEHITISLCEACIEISETAPRTRKKIKEFTQEVRKKEKCALELIIEANEELKELIKAAKYTDLGH